jgi:cell pole-organizing protein PopZ
MAEAAEKKENATESPSMEEILKSIRGVISGEEAAESAESAENADEEMLELTEMEIAEDEAPLAADAANLATAGSAEAEKSVLDDIDAAIGVDDAAEKLAEQKAEAEKVEAEKAAVEAAAAAAEMAMASENDVLEASDSPAEPVDENLTKTVAKESVKSGEPLLKEQVADESSETLRVLVSNIPRTHVSSPYTKGGITLEELTIEAMRPLLAEWLNENLPVIVKQIVSKEIKKLIPQDDEK